MPVPDRPTDAELVRRVDAATRVDRAVSWIGWRLPELVTAGACAAVGATVFPPAFVLTAAALGWIPAERILQRRNDRRDRVEAPATTTTDQDAERDTTEVQTA